MSQMPLTVGMLYPGDMGATLAALLRTRGVRVVTALQGRSERTMRLSRQAGVIELDSLAQVVRQAQIIISLVPPAAAEEVADSYCRLAPLSHPSAIYVDVNAISPELCELLAAKLAGCDRQFVDASINGMAKTVATAGTLFLSGRRAGEVAGLFDGLVTVRVLGEPVGLASAMKMLLSGLSKGVCALFLEVALLAQRRGMLAPMLESSSQIYPGISELARRMMPTIPQHCVRRVSEMRELEEMTISSRQSPCLIAAVRQLHEELASLPPQTLSAGDPAAVTSLIEHWVLEGVLAGALPAQARVQIH